MIVINRFNVNYSSMINESGSFDQRIMSSQEFIATVMYRFSNYYKYNHVIDTLQSVITDNFNRNGSSNYSDNAVSYNGALYKTGLPNNTCYEAKNNILPLDSLLEDQFETALGQYLHINRICALSEMHLKTALSVAKTKGELCYATLQCFHAAILDVLNYLDSNNKGLDKVFAVDGNIISIHRQPALQRVIDNADELVKAFNLYELNKITS